MMTDILMVIVEMPLIILDDDDTNDSQHPFQLGKEYSFHTLGFHLPLGTQRLPRRQKSRTLTRRQQRMGRCLSGFRACYFEVYGLGV